MICADAFFYGLVWIFFQIRLIFVNMSGLSFWCTMRFCWSCCIHTICSPGSMPTWCGGGMPSRSRSICEIAGFAYSGNWEGWMPLHWDGERKTMSNNKSTVLKNASHTVCSIPSNAGPVETDLLRPLVRFWSLPIPCNKSRNENKKELTDNVGVIYIFVCRGIGYGQAIMKRFKRLKTKALIV